MSESNAFSGLQLIALHGLLTTGEGLATPTAGAVSTAAFEAIPTVAGFKSMLTTAGTAGLSEPELQTLKTIGAGSIPSLFGSLPDFASAPTPTSPGLQPGFALDQIAGTQVNLFPTPGDVSIFTQTFTQASGYASMSYDVLKSAATATFGSFNDVGKLVSGGLTNIVGESKDALVALGTGLDGAGGIFDVTKLGSAFSSAGTLKTVLDAGEDQVGNLQAKVLGQTLTDASGNVVRDKDGAPIVITRDFINSIVANPPNAVEEVNSISPAIRGAVQSSQLDQLLGSFVNKSLTDPTEINAIASFNKLSGSGSAASTFSALINPATQLGNAASVLPSTDPTALNNLFKSSIGGIENLTDTKALALACQNIEPLDSSLNLIKDLTIPLSYDEFAELVGAMGGGSGPFGNAQVSDFMGADPTSAIASVTPVVTQLAAIPESITIASDLSLLNLALAGTLPQMFSNGSVALTASDAVTMGSAVINSNAALVKTFADTNSLSHQLTQYTTATSVNNIGQLLYGKANIDTKSMKADVGSVVGFVSSLHSAATDTTLGTGTVLSRYADPTTKAGQAILGALTEGKNLATLSKAGIKADNFTSVPNYSGEGIGTNPPPPPNPSGAPVPNPGATTPKILSVKAYRPVGSSVPQFEMRYEGVVNWQQTGWLAGNTAGNMYSIWNGNYPSLPGQSGIIVADANANLPDGTVVGFLILGNAVGVNMGVWVTPNTFPLPEATLTSNTTAWPSAGGDAGTGTPGYPPGGINLPWPPGQNTRTFIQVGLDGWDREIEMYFTTGATGEATQINAVGYDGYPDIFRQWTVYDINGSIIVTQNGQSSQIRVVVGPTRYNNDLTHSVLAYGLRPNTSYAFKSRNINPDGSPSSAPGRDYSYLVDMNHLVLP